MRLNLSRVMYIILSVSFLWHHVYCNKHWMCLLLQPDTDLHDSHRRSYIFFVTPCILQHTQSVSVDAASHRSTWFSSVFSHLFCDTVYIATNVKCAFWMQPHTGLHDSHWRSCIFFVTSCILQQTLSVSFECSLTPVYMILIGVLASFLWHRVYCNKHWVCCCSLTLVYMILIGVFASFLWHRVYCNKHRVCFLNAASHRSTWFSSVSLRRCLSTLVAVRSGRTSTLLMSCINLARTIGGQIFSMSTTLSIPYIRFCTFSLFHTVVVW